MTSRLPYQWPIILSIVLHASIFVAGFVMADLLDESERSKPAATIINITMNASEPVLEEKTGPKQETYSKQEEVIETVSASQPIPVVATNLVKNPEPVIKEKPLPEQKKQQETPIEMQDPELLQEKELQQETTKQEFSKQALIMQEQVINQQLAEQTAEAETQYHDQILSLIESNKFYPKRAKKMRQEGDVIVTFTLNRDGSIQDLKVLNDTAPWLLKRAALKAIRISALFPSFPSDSNRSTWSFETKLSYRLF